MARTELTIAVCLFQGAGATDFQGPLEAFGFLSQKSVDVGLIPASVGTFIKPTYLGVTMDTITAMTGPQFLVNKTYEEVLKEGTQFDVILVPGGWNTDRAHVEPAVVDFVKKQTPGAKYVMSACTGAEILAAADVLNGKRATVTKSNLLRIAGDFKDKNIEWVHKARWVVDGKVWTSSGMTSGVDMGYAFVKHLVGREIAEIIRGTMEFSLHEEDQDEFAAFHGLV